MHKNASEVFVKERLIELGQAFLNYFACTVSNNDMLKQWELN